MNGLKERRSAFFDCMTENSLLLLYSGEEIPFSLDAFYPFECNHHFFYLTGLRREKMALVMSTCADKEETILFIEMPEPLKVRWTGRRVSVEEAREISGIEDVRDIRTLDEYLGRLHAREQVTLAWFDCHREAVDAPESFNLMQCRRYAQAYPGVQICDLHPVLAAARMIKDEDEIRKIERAIELTHAGLERVWRSVKPGMTEYQAQALFEYQIRFDGAEGTAFDTISASGENACLLHYRENSRAICEDELLLMDLGARFQGYCADITRTFPVSGTFTPRERQVYDIVLEANRKVAETAAPGMTLGELNEVCRETLAEGLIRLGLIEKPEEVSRYYMHNVSHHLGIDTHDAVCSGSMPLEAGMVITDEPGLYIDEWKIGIRIEDDLLITENGCRVLSHAIPKDPDALEKLLSPAREEA